ncbi:unnamed protein product [Brassica napus]|uniref:(rape) hypothetical protein n=1 Tax=Brassica napus TaxID=3708 RepID=A0A816IJE8_BRANA|nr:unnamed protein product [Brassica napus]
MRDHHRCTISSHTPLLHSSFLAIKQMPVPSRFQESVATNGVEIGVVQQKLLMLLQAKNKLKLLRFRDSSDQSQRKGETVDQTEDFSMEICQGTAAVFVCDQPGGETILVDQMIVDRSKPGGYGQRTYRTTFLPEGSKV